MTIEYKDSKRIVASSDDTVETPTYSDDFSGTDDWADQGSGVGVNTTTDRLEFDSWTDNSTNNSSTLDLGSALSDTAWVIRFKLQWTGFSNTTDWTAPAIGMFSADSSTGGNSAQDMLFYWSIANGSEKRVYLSSADNSTISGTDHNLNLSWKLNTTYYVELVRDGSNFSATVWTGKFGGSIVASGTDTIGGTVSGLQYFGAKSPVTNRGGSFSGWLDNLKIWNGVTSVTDRPTNVQDNSLLVEKDTGDRYWFDAESARTPTYTADLSTSSWTTGGTGTQVTVDTINEEIDFSVPSTSSHLAQAYYDLTTVSDTNWVIRSQLDLDTVTQGSVVNDVFFSHGIGSISNNINDSQDFLGLMIRVDDTKTDIFAVETDGSAPNNETTTLFTRQAQAETLYVEMKRDSSTSFTINLYSDSGYSTLLESKTITIPSSLTGLRYIKVTSLQGFSDSELIGSVSNIKFYNGVTSTTAPATWNNPYGDYVFTFNNDQTGNEAQTYVYVDTTNSWWYGYSGTNASADTGQYINLGSELSDDWTMAFKVITNQDGNTNSLNAIIGFSLSNNTGVSWTTTTHDFVSVWFNTDSSSRRNIRHSYGVNQTGSGTGSIYLVDNTGTYGGDTLPDATDITLYVVVNKNGTTTTAKLYTDSALQNQYGVTGTNTSVTSSNLQYLKLISRSASGTDNQAIVKIQSVQIKDGDADWTPKWIEG